MATVSLNRLIEKMKLENLTPELDLGKKITQPDIKECFLDVPYARQTPQEPRVYNSTSFHLNYTLCFVHNVDKPFTPCIFLKKKIIRS